MATNFYYVYALKDPRSNPARPFYIGKGAGSRAFDHLVKPDNTKKYARIKDIKRSGVDPVVNILVDDLTYSVLGLLMREGKVIRVEGERPRYVVKS